MSMKNFIFKDIIKSKGPVVRELRFWQYSWWKVRYSVQLMKS